MGFLKRLFGFFTAVAPPAAEQQSSQVGSTMPIAEISRSVVISWQELIGEDSRIAGYRLPASPLQAGEGISGTQLFSALERENLVRLAERRQVLIPISVEQWQGANFCTLVAARTCFQLIGPVVSTEILGRIAKEIREQGAKLAVDVAQLGVLEAAGGVPDLLVLDARGVELVAFEKLVKEIRQRYPKLVLIVNDVESWAEFRWFQAQGITYCIGGFAAMPDQTEQPARMGQSRLVVLEMLNQLRSDVDLGKVVATAKRDPAVVLKLLEMANSPFSGLSRQVSSLDDAIMLLGRDAVYRWLSIAMFSIDSQGGRDETLLVIALSRASFLEALAPDNDKKAAAELFLVGMLSVIDSLTGLPMKQALDKMHLPAAVSIALLKSEGGYAKYLLLAVALERCRIEYAVSLAGLLKIEPAHLLNCYSKAMEWAVSDLPIKR